MAGGVAAHLVLFAVLLIAMWVLWRGGNRDYFMLGAPMLLVNIAAGAYYGIVIAVMVVRRRAQRHAC
jgi:hypothetical protein